MYGIASGAGIGALRYLNSGQRSWTHSLDHPVQRSSFLLRSETGGKLGSWNFHVCDLCFLVSRGLRSDPLAEHASHTPGPCAERNGKTSSR